MSVWPLFDLRIQTPLLELKLPKDNDLLDLAERARGNILDADSQHYMNGWTLDESPTFYTNFLQYHWGIRASFSPDHWQLMLGIYLQGETQPIGMMDINAQHFLQRKLVETGSWILKDHQGQGLGREARAAVLQLAFAGLGAAEAHSSAAVDNQVSGRVSLGLGYELNGKFIVKSGDLGQPVQSYRLTKGNWQSRDDIQIIGLDECLSLFGLD